MNFARLPRIRRKPIIKLSRIFCRLSRRLKDLKYHGTAFKNLDEAFDPQKNANYSAQFLRSLYKRNKQNWTKTAMHYHSRNLRRGTNYKKRLEKHYAEYVREDGGAAKLF